MQRVERQPQPTGKQAPAIREVIEKLSFLGRISIGDQLRLLNPDNGYSTSGEKYEVGSRVYTQAQWDEEWAGARDGENRSPHESIAQVVTGRKVEIATRAAVAGGILVGGGIAADTIFNHASYGYVQGLDTGDGPQPEIDIVVGDEIIIDLPEEPIEEPMAGTEDGEGQSEPPSEQAAQFLTEQRDGFYESGPFDLPEGRIEFVRLETPSATFHFMGSDVRFIIDPGQYSKYFDTFLQTYNTTGAPIEIFIYDVHAPVSFIDSNDRNVVNEIQQRIEVQNWDMRTWFLAHPFFRDNWALAGVNNQTGAFELHVGLSPRPGVDPYALAHEGEGSRRVNVLLLWSLGSAFFNIEDINAPELRQFTLPMGLDWAEGRAPLPLAIVLSSAA